ncbi:hypothetical protein [Actinotalea sp.]|uniref:hypothetical protein n=1 Tax=Actinotalea sp. TaxID=1872145 RepID=UPI002CF0779E|nr:hypothetical protein [Actinotalea sp.]HRA50628.1 hypothetical protein [Actinotalea sp.]
MGFAGAVVGGCTLVLAAAACLLATPSGAAFTASAGTGSVLASDTLDPPGALTATRSCAMTAPTLRSVSQATATATSITVARPAGVLPGDALIAIVMHHDSSSEPVAAVAGGWGMEIPSHSSLGGEALMVLKIATAAEPASYSFAGLDSSDATAVVVLAYTGVDPTTPLAATPAGQANANGSTVAAPSVTTDRAGATFVTAFLADDYASTISVPAGTTSRADVLAAGPQEVRVRVTDRVIPAAGATGVTAATLTTSRYSHGFAVALRGTMPVTLTWTPTPDTYATGYEGFREDVNELVPVLDRTTSTFVDGSAGAAQMAYQVRSVGGTWRSPYARVVVPAC